MTYQWIAISVALVASLVAFWVAARALADVRLNHEHPSLRRRLAAVEVELLEALDRLDKLSGLAKRKYARDAQRKRRSADVQPVEETDEQWKQRMEKEHALGITKRT